MARETRNSRLIKGFQDERMKVYTVPVSGTDPRIKYLFEAYSDSKEGDECTLTVYVYFTDSDDVGYTIERKSKWKSAWDATAEATAIALGYDLDGSGV